MSTVQAPITQALPIREWCQLNALSLSQYRKLRAKGLGPETIQIGGGALRKREVVTPEATLEWRRRMATRPGALRARMRSVGWEIRDAAHAPLATGFSTFAEAEAALIRDFADRADLVLTERFVRAVDAEHEGGRRHG